ncbi:C-5 cytosine-specific DNA methylase [Ochrobactrum sp. 30A/1000/2015]|nr:C-5 cytosine-specific DNA methylase [Ochrobactrum sp. 30A/1000/2015]PJT37036.1 C-5 cytosine-specific DNA methylase [Ochrobactrum sp. 27A/999/2015]PJT45311.1 C-5 cytosine-specific DNA methylase [Ochrobactrum sp. 23A/997/2015]
MILPLIVDSFAGGGGASTGIEMALGRSPDIAINHNAAALALHEANHPHTLHLSENVYKIDPLDYLRGAHVGLGWFSPDCKHFSKAKGGKPVERNIRDLAWIIPGWIERIQRSGGKVDVVILENVEEFQDYGPLMETARGLMPDPERKGEYFKKWCRKIRLLGGKIEWRELRACDYGAPTIRKRFFAVIRFDGQPIVWPKPTHGAPTDPDVISGHKLPWRTAAEIIDWSLPCPSIFDTSEQIMEKHGLRSVRPLADNTMARVARGMKRYVLDAERPFLVNLTHGGRVEAVDEPFKTITGAHRGEKAVVSPHLASYYSHDKGRSERISEIDGPLATVVTENRHALIAPSVIRFNTGATGQDAREPLSTVTANSFIKRPGGAAPLGVVAPHLMTMRNAGKPFNGADEPTHTITAGGAGLTVVAPVLTAAQHGGSTRSIDSPAHTITASTKDQNSVIVPTLVGCGGRAGQSRPRGADEPMHTTTAKADTCIATAFVARDFGTSTGHGVDVPAHTVMPDGQGKSRLITAYMAQHNNDSRREGGVNPGRSMDEPVSTVTQTGSQQSVVAPYLQAYYGSGDGGEENQPVRTVTTKDRHGHVEAALDVPPFTSAEAERAREVAAFLRAYGFWDEREFVTIEAGGVVYVIVDIGMRMLVPRELYLAQGFPPDYEIERGVNGELFSKSVQVSCCGNSVSPPVAAALVAANCSHLALRMEAAE